MSDTSDSEMSDTIPMSPLMKDLHSSTLCTEPYQKHLDHSLSVRKNVKITVEKILYYKEALTIVRDTLTSKSKSLFFIYFYFYN